MNGKEIILAALAPAEGAYHTPVQVQKLLFLIDKEIPQLVDGPYFAFKPYNYGPFDKTIYDELNGLIQDGYVNVALENTWFDYRLTEKGQEKGNELLALLKPKAQDFIQQVSKFVRSLTFEQLVSAIYKAYPDMQRNSVFQGCE